jgi:phosphoserine phosphatase
MAAQPRDAVCFHRRQQRIKPSGVEETHFLKRAGCQHGVEPGIDAAMKLGALRRDKDFRDIVRIDQRDLTRLMPVRKRAPGRLQDLQGARDAHPVTRGQPGRGGGIFLLKQHVQHFRAFCRQAAANPFADVRRDRRDRRKSYGERFEIQPRPADEYRQASVPARVAESIFRITQPATHRIILRRIDMAVEEVRDARLLYGGWPGREKPEIAVDLHRIRIDDDAAEPFGKRKRERRLAARGRSCDKQRPFCPALLRLAVFRRAIIGMTHVLSLISNPAAHILDATMLRRASEFLPDPGTPNWLDAGTAADILFTPHPATDNRRTTDAVRKALGEKVDVVVQPVAHRRKRLFLADMDSTMIGQECIDELADYAGFKQPVSAITERAMRGEIAFEPALRERVALLAKLPATIVEKVLVERVTLTPGARTLVATMRANGAYTCLVSGGFTLFTEPVGRMIGFDENRANTLLIGTDGNFLGEVAEPILGREAKLATLVELMKKLQFDKDDVLAVGDGANDLPMIQAAGMGVAYHAKPVVAESAAARIEHGDLTALLYLQGYRRDQFVES